MGHQVEAGDLCELMSWGAAEKRSMLEGVGVMTPGFGAVDAVYVVFFRVISVMRFHVFMIFGLYMAQLSVNVIERRHCVKACKNEASWYWLRRILIKWRRFTVHIQMLHCHRYFRLLEFKYSTAKYLQSDIYA